MKIKFGTAGWRAVISDEFTFKNVRLVTQAIADYLLNNGKGKKTVVVGYDTRFESEDFAKAAMEVLCSNNIRVFLTNRDTPTPVIAYHILKKKASGGINITASHNPPEYNGIKFSPAYGGPAQTEVTDWIERRINQLIEEGWQAGHKKGKEDRACVKIFDPRPEYLAHIKSLVDTNSIRKAKLKIVIDCRYGTSRSYLDKILEDMGCKVKVLNVELNPLFGGTPPEPSMNNLKNLALEVKKSGANVGLATDGDADRFGIIDSDGTYITPNQVITLVLEHLASTRVHRGTEVVRTVATTHMVDVVAKEKGLKVIEVPVGFKYIGPEISKGYCLMGGEESGGLSIMNHVPEKDGILACLLVAEMVATKKIAISAMLEKLYKRFGKFYSDRLDLHLDSESKDKLVGKLKTNPPRKIAGIEVGSINKLDGHKFILKDNSWVLLRLSGTEPIVRCYIEAHSKRKLDEMTKAIQRYINS